MTYDPCTNICGKHRLPFVLMEDGSLYDPMREATIEEEEGYPTNREERGGPCSP